jgi:DNA-binding transcriptional LysR family regulator
MELRHLRYFVVTAEELHFTRAAQRIGIAQPPLTKQIKALEEELDVRLFDRLPGQVRLTEAGEVFLREAQDILDRVARAVVRSRATARGEIGSLRVGFTESASFHPAVTAALQHFRARYTEVQLSLEENRSTQLVEALKQERLDAAFVRLPIAMDETIRFELLSTEPMVVVVPKRHLLARRKSVSLRELEHEPFVLYPRSSRFGLSDAIVAACETEGFSPVVVQHAPQISSTINLVASSLGITIVPQCMRQSRTDAVRYVSLRDTSLKATLGIVYRARSTACAVENLAALARRYAHEHEVAASR